MRNLPHQEMLNFHSTRGDWGLGKYRHGPKMYPRSTSRGKSWVLAELDLNLEGNVIIGTLASVY